MNSLSDLTADQLQEALRIRKQIDGLRQQIEKLLGVSSPVKGPASKATPTVKAGKRQISPEARARMAAAQKARWAAVKAPSKAAPAKPATTPQPVKQTPAANAPKKKGGLTPEGRAKLAAAMSARWAAKKKAGQ